MNPIRTVFNQTLGCPTSEAWYRHGKLHRTDGPALTVGKYQAWWEDGVQLKVIFESGYVYER